MSLSISTSTLPVRYWNSLKATYLTVRDEYIAEALNLGIDLSCDYSSINSLNTQIPTSNDGTINTEIIITLNANAFDLHRLGGFCAEELYLKAKIETLLLELEQLQPSLPKTLQESCNKVINTLNTFIQLSSVFLSEPKGF